MKGAVAADDVGMSRGGVNLVLRVRDPLGLVRVIIIEPAIALFRQLLRRVENPERIGIDEMMCFGMGDRKGSRCTGFEDLAQRAGLDAGPAFESLVRRKPRGGRGPVWLRDLWGFAH